MLQIEDLVTGYSRIEVLHGISLTVEKGEAIGVLGANGAGKTTLLKSIIGLLKPWQGRVVLNGSPVGGLPPHAMINKGVVLVPEGRGIFYPLTVAENLELGYIVANRRSSNMVWKQQVEWVLQLFPELGKRWRQRAGNLSGGQQQMLAIGRALMSQPKLLLLDEPSLGLAPLVVEAIFEALHQLVTSGMTLILVEQNTENAMVLVKRVYVLVTGRIVLSAQTPELKANPALLEDAYLSTVTGGNNA